MRKDPGFTATTKWQRGFTLIEMSLVMGIFLTLLSITFVGFLNFQHRSALFANTAVLLADIQSQQTKAMAGDTEASNTISDFGIHFEASSYTLFRGSSYSAGEPTNMAISLEPPLSFEEIDLPQTAVVFAKGSGEVAGYSAPDNSVKVKNNESGEEVLVQFNKYGVLVSGE